MLRIKNWQELSACQKKEVLSRPPQSHALGAQVREIIDMVKKEGDVALGKWTREFDHVDLKTLTISQEEMEEASLPAKSLAAIQVAVENITRFHRSMLPQNHSVRIVHGVTLERIHRPMSRVGFYVPGGRNTPLISSLLMQAIPAQVAGCPLRILCTPPKSDGTIDPALLVAARLCNIEKIYKIGGAQAIAAMAYGSETVPKVDKIFGPGNAYVTEAKVQVSIDPAGAAIDMPAGPSEVLIIADREANPNFVAADLLAQGEHGPDSQVLLLCQDQVFAEAVNKALGEQYERLKRKELLQQSLQKSAILLCADRSMMIEITNEYAPEHLMIQCSDAASWVEEITAAGTIFLGSWAAETLGDYVTGSNHILPTYGHARCQSGLSTGDFLKFICVQSISEDGLKTLGGAAHTLAMMEGLDGHANAITQRLALARISHECS
jgi:histidinol dehydrogenase